MAAPIDPFQLQRFVNAQDGVFERAVAELRSGRKRSHWMWFVFPQIEGLGQSPMSRRYAIRSLEEARAYLAHPLLGPRLLLATEVALASGRTRGAGAVFGEIDALKLRSSLTLFAAADPGEPLFSDALRLLFGTPDERTLQRLG
jgi:uncharacterized protein (DUF1810 family)